MDRGAGVVAFPTNVEELKSDASIKLPVPFGERVRLSSDSVPIVAAAPAPRLRVVDEIPRVAAVVIVAKFAAVIVVRPEAASVVSSAAIVSVLLPESRVRVEVVEPMVPAPVKVNESTSRTVPSTDTKPKFPSSLIVTDPVPAATSNSVKSMAVAPPVIDVKDVPVMVVPVIVKLPLRVVLSARVIALDPESITMFPVVAPPNVRVPMLREERVPVEAVKDNPLLLDAEIVATGRSFATPVIANCAADVDVPPTNKSTVVFLGVRAPLT